MSMPLVEYARDGDVGLLTLNRANAGNAVDTNLVTDFSAGVDALYADRPRSILITGRGKNFCLGGDVQQLAAAGPAIADALESLATAFHAAQLKLYNYPAPVVSAVQGNAIGGGLGLALSADFVIGASSARFSTGYARLGLSPDAGVSYFLTRAIGARRARTLLMDSRFLDANEAQALGLIDSVVPEDDLADKAAALAQKFAKGPTTAFAAIKRLTDASATSSLAEQFELETTEITALARSDAAIQSIRAAVEKLKPAGAN